MRAMADGLQRRWGGRRDFIGGSGDAKRSAAREKRRAGADMVLGWRNETDASVSVAGAEMIPPARCRCSAVHLMFLSYPSVGP